MKPIISALGKPFKRLKIIYQILIIVGILIIFSSIQGITGIRIIDTLNENSSIIFDKSMKLMVALQELQGDLMDLKTSYINDIAKSTNDTQSLFSLSFEPGMASRLQNIKTIDPNAVSVVEEKLHKIKLIMALPVNPVNGKELEKVIFEVKSSLKEYIDQVLLSSYRVMEEGEKSSQIARNNTIILLIVGSLVAILIGLIITFLIVRPLKTVGKTAKALAVGDLTQNIAVGGSQEVSVMIGDLNKAIDSLRELVLGINEGSSAIARASLELTETSGNTGKSAMEVATTMGELARAASDQASQTNVAVGEIDALSELVRLVAAEVGNISIESKSVAQSAILGQQATKDVAAEIVKIYDMTKDITVVIDQFDKTSREITSITEIIHNIAEQSTLLSLNASIEAAHAKEHGRGFAIVANQTKKLAEQTKEAAQLIGDLISQMDQQTRQVVKWTADGMNVVTVGKNMAMEATDKFEAIFNKLGNILNRIDAVAFSAQKMAENNEGMISVINNIAGVCQESMASTEEISSASQEQCAAMEQVNGLAENLASISQKLEQSVARFTLTKPDLVKN